MQITVMAGGKVWYVDESALLNWLVANAVQKETPKVVVREVIDGQETGRMLLNEAINR